MKYLKVIPVSSLLLITIIAVSCSNQFERVPKDQFIGAWELKGRSMFEGIVIDIKRNNKDQLVGTIIKLNKNKYVQMLSEVGDVWVSEISRSSNFQFNLTERKIGRELFGLYGLSTSTEFKVQFIDNNTLGLSTNGDPTKSTVQYKRTPFD